ncbi:MAG: AraC family transcriptional regulator [Lachnospiraceae bacterium]|nr:AraC family transcriptional regulator [Lachnospiraceae bacterium]
MKPEDLNTFLFRYTDSEKRHRSTERRVLSPRYEKIPRISFQGRQVYQFSFNKLFENKYVCVNKESRFTYIPEHIHTVIEFLYVYAGTCTQVINGTSVAMNQGDICLLDTNVPHSVRYLEESDIVITIEMRREYLTQGFLYRLGDNGLINQFLINTLSANAAHDQYLLFTKRQENPIHSVIQNILCEYYDPGICSDKMIDAYMILLFCEIMRQYRDRQLASRDHTIRQIMEILQYIEAHSLTATLKETAGYFGFHPNYLSAFIKKNTGRSFKELLILQRMSQACFYLSNTDLSVSDIAARVGYENLGYFYKKFETIYQMSPASYRRLKLLP